MGLALSKGGVVLSVELLPQLVELGQGGVVAALECDVGGHGAMEVAAELGHALLELADAAEELRPLVGPGEALAVELHREGADLLVDGGEPR
jgi:hypothetical protein